MAAVGKAKEEAAKEETMDVMADAPPERPYGEAITDEHYEVLKDAGQAPERSASE